MRHNAEQQAAENLQSRHKEAGVANGHFCSVKRSWSICSNSYSSSRKYAGLPVELTRVTVASLYMVGPGLDQLACFLHVIYRWLVSYACPHSASSNSALEQVGGCLYISKLFHLSSSLRKQVNLHCSNIIALKKERTHYFSDVSWSTAPLLGTQ